MDILGPATALAREVGDRYAEKVAFDRLAHAHRELGDHARALGHFERALTMARDLGDRGHEAVLSWHASIQDAELGRAGPAIARGQAAVDLLHLLNQP